MKQNSKILTLILFSAFLFNLSAQDSNFDNDPIVNSSEDERKFRFGLKF